MLGNNADHKHVASFSSKKVGWYTKYMIRDNVGPTSRNDRLRTYQMEPHRLYVVDNWMCVYGYLLIHTNEFENMQQVR